MTERVSNAYKRLFEIRLLHHYWLDEGKTIFDLIAAQDKRDSRLLSYDRRPFLALTPTETTARTLAGLDSVYKNTQLGGVVGVPDSVEVPAEAVFVFIVTVADAALINYTALTLPPQKIYEIFHQSQKRTYRYKENVPVLTNQAGAARGTGINKALYLSKEIPALVAEDKVESLVQVSGALMQLTSDQPNATQQQLNAQAANLPVFLHQGDIPAIIAPAGLVGVPAKGIALSDDVPDEVFALIEIRAVRPDDADFSFIDSNGHAKAAAPVFQVRFKNRSTVWRYLNKNTGQVMSTETAPLPLTHFGNAGTKQKPSADMVKVETIGTKISQLVSDIFV